MNREKCRIYLKHWRKKNPQKIKKYYTEFMSNPKNKKKIGARKRFFREVYWPNYYMSEKNILARLRHYRKKLKEIRKYKEKVGFVNREARK